ncbi:hypothetical protein HMPREF9104_02478 [Lentilactobacillus kisonensis F0435]|uniref:Uncharacterized protein n=1 Tax=Lentilactobacillus kisonensis F0435 TaxID=797516 RepID=H1LIN7_9LACO|nr:hypothetical protein HMPREF9104_02478 [Lentilactobacillus kisonensis F0435]
MQSRTLHISTTSKNSKTGNSCRRRLMLRVLTALLRSLIRTAPQSRNLREHTL